MIGRRHDRTGRSTSEPVRKSKVKSGPKECGFERFVWFPLDLMDSAVFASLSVSAMRVLHRLTVEHAHHGGQENGRLIVTHEQFQQFGITAANVRCAIDECVTFGLVRVRWGGRRAFSNRPNRFRLTWYGWVDDDGTIHDPSNEWKGIEADDIQAFRAKQKTKRAADRKRRERKKTDGTPEKHSTVPLK